MSEDISQQHEDGMHAKAYSESALVQEMRRLRAFPSNCDAANQLIDRAIAAQIEAEARNKPTQ